MITQAHPFLAALAAGGLLAATALAADPQPPNKISAPIKLNESATLPLENGCHYTAKLNGTVTPAGGTAEQQKLNSNVTINAGVSCPDAGEQKVTETLVRQGMTPRELLDALALHGSVLSSAPGPRCAFVPELSFAGENKLKIDAVSHLCPIGPGGQPCQPGLPGQPGKSPASP